MNKIQRRIADARRPARDADLETLPGIGPSIAEDLRALGVRRVGDLVGRDPEDLYRRSCTLAGTTIDRCLLYVYRCACYAARTARPAPEKLDWWWWKDRVGRSPSGRASVGDSIQRR